ncbi:MAG: BTAD domain-containing putative transcriptional regulator, partial [Gaiellaceae bacterium]
MPSVLQLRVFLAGRVAVETGSVVIDERRFPGRQGRVVFAYLVVQQGRPVPRDELAEALWGEALPLTWDKALTVIASKLRSLLTDSGVDGSSALTGAFGCYRLELPGGTWVDVVAARRAAQMAEDAFASGDTEKAKREATLAASLLQQPFLPGEDGMWVGETRRDLTGVRARAMSVLADTCLRLGETSEAANWAEQVIALEPFRETGYRRLMDAHVAAGNRAEALRVYERCRRLLAEELGAYPSPETESVYRGLLEGSSAQTAASVAVVRQPPRPPRLGDLDGAIPQRGVSVGGRRPLWGRRAFLAPAAVAVLGVVGIVTVVLAGPPFGSHQTAAGVVAADSLGVFEASGRAIADTAVGTGPHGVAVGAGSIWLTNTDGNSVSRIDPKTNAVVQTIDVTDGPEGVAFGGGFVWVADSLANTVSQIDPGTNTVVRRISVGNGPTGVAFGLHGVWVTDVADRTLVRIDPRTGSAGRPLTVDKGADAVAVGGGSVWVTSGGSPGSVARIDPRADAVVETISVGNDPSAIAAGTGAVWVANTEDGTVSQIDPASNRQTSVIPVGAGPAGIALGREAVWVANELGGTISKIDPARGKVVQTVETDNLPLGIAAAADTLYVAVRTYGRAHRGGTLRLLSPPFVSFAPVPILDPADIYVPAGDQILVITNDGLTGYRRTGGADGLQLVPDLATSLPEPTDGARTYTLQLRHGIHYSTGALVRPPDFRRALERSLADKAG